MADATMGEIVDAVWVLLKAALSCPVENGWKDDIGTQLTVQVIRKGDTAEDGLHMAGDLSGGVTFKRHQLSIIIETPFDGNEAEAEVDAVRESVRQVIEANRDLAISGKDDPAAGNDDGCTYQYVTRKGQAHDNWAAFVTASWRV